MLRLLGSLLTILVLSVAGGYLVWGARVGNLTESLNAMILQQETLTTRLAAQVRRTGARVVDGSETGEDGAALGGSGAEILASLNALKQEVQFQAKLIDQQSRVINKVAGDGPGGPGGCREATDQVRSQLQRCMVENVALRKRAEGEPEAPSGWPNQETPSAWPSPQTPPAAAPSPSADPRYNAPTAAPPVGGRIQAPPVLGPRNY